MKKKKLITLVVLGAIIIAGILAARGIKGFLDLKNYRKQIDDIVISNVDLSKIDDGTYTGEYEVVWVGAEVKVTVKDNKIEGIELVKHKNGKGESAEIITSKVVEAQSLEVDAVTGATSSSKVILKAIENALNSSSK